MLRWILLVVFFCFTTIYSDGQENLELDVATFTTDQEASMTSSAQKHEFQAEVSRLMEIIINSLYKTRDIFLRELISNANDALDKIRYQSLTDKSVLNGPKELGIRVQADSEKGTLTILDTGIGMTKEELAKNLGTIAHSGTASFLDAFSNAAESGQNPLQLIGQFGVGFYSAFLVADEVIVVSKSNNSPKQYIWRSTANGSYSISEDPRGNTLSRGTAVILKIKDDAKEFLDNDQIEKIVTRYSEFMQYPILLYTTRTETVEEPSAEEPIDTDEELKAQDEEEKPKEKKSVNYWKQLNKNKPLWTRRPSEISEEEYNEFYKAFAHATETPLQYTHFRAEGEVEFDSIIFVPQKAPWGLYDNYYTQKSALRLYVRRVLVADKFEDIIPRYLNFIQGLIDSNDLPLNVNREDLQKNKILSLISRKLTRKALDMLVDLAKEDETETETETGNENDKDKKKELTDKKGKYDSFWKEFGKSIKLGVIEDQRNRKRLLELLRFPTSKSPNKPISLKNYIDNMKSGQKYIYYLSAASLEDAQNSPFLERLKSKDIEVLFFIDNLDEYLNIQDYDEYTLQSITKEGVEVDGKKMKEFLQAKEEEFSELKKWFKNIFGNKISKVQISSTLELSPMAISTSKFGSSANMERISKAQAFGGNINPQMKATKILEINYRHPIIKELQNKINSGNSDDKNLQDYANLLLDMALIKSGFDIEPLEQNTFASRISRIVQNGLNIPLDTKLEDEPDFAKELTEEENEQEDQEEEDEDVEEADEDEDKSEL